MACRLVTRTFHVAAVVLAILGVSAGLAGEWAPEWTAPLGDLVGVLGAAVILLAIGRVVSHWIIAASVKGRNRVFELCRANERLAETSHQLEEAQGLANAASTSKRELLANLSHEIRTPLNAIIGMTELVLDGRLEPTQRDFLNKSLTSARSLLEILNDLLDFSKIDSGRLEVEQVPFGLSEVLEGVARVSRARAEKKGLELHFNVESEVPERLVGDPLRLGQVLLNLVSNAVKFTDEGEIVASVGVVDRGAERIELRFDVRDTGIGISENDIERLFLSFEQGDASSTRRHGGTGLGLCISKQLVERMGGQIWVESALGRGSTFSFCIEVGIAKAECSTPPAALRGRHVLLVEDDSAARNVLQRELCSLGLEVSTTDSGEQAVHWAVAPPHPVDIVLIDHRMGDWDGIETARQLEKVWRDGERPLVFLMTAHAGPELQDPIEGVKLAGLLVKPLYRCALAHTLSEALSQKAPTIEANAGDVSTLRETAKERLAGARVLLVEDNELNQKLAVELLRQIDIEVEVASDGAQAVQAVARRRYDAVLMDIQMPNMDGFAATRAIRLHPQHYDLPIVAMTAHARAEDREACADAGMNDHVSKPIARNELYQALMQWIVRHDVVLPSKPVPKRARSKSPFPSRRLNHHPTRPSEPTGALAATPAQSRARPPQRDACVALTERDDDEVVPQSDALRVYLGREEGFIEPETLERVGSGLPSHMPGLNVAVGVEQTGGREAFYLEILEGFISKSRSAPTDIARLLRAGELETAYRTVHTLKGLAGSVGALELRESARRLENAVRANDPNELAEMLAELDHNLRPVLTSAEDLFGRLHRGAADAAGNSSEPPQHASEIVPPLLRELRAHLAASDLVDHDVLDRLGKALRGKVSDGEWLEMKDCVHNFEYDQALAKVHSIAARLEVDL